MTDDKRLREAVVIAAGQQQRLERLERQVAEEKAADPGGDAARAEADLVLGAREWSDSDSDSNELRREADRLLGSPTPPFDVYSVAPSEELSWASLLETNCEVLRSDGIDPESVVIDELFAPDVLARIDAEWGQRSAALDRHLDERELEALTASCRRAVVDAIVRPLGLGRLIARFDRDGGSVLTQHNAEAARQGAIDFDALANTSRARAYADRQDKSEDPERSRHGSSLFREARARGGTEDAYRDVPLEAPELDHVVAASRLDRNQRVNFHFDEQAKEQLINSEENLDWTARGVNRSKGSSAAQEWMERERADGSTNGERWGVNAEKMAERVERAEEFIQSAVRSEEFRYYLKETARAGAADAMKMGLQQAIGAALVELVTSLFDEVADLWRNGRQQVSLVDEFVVRAKRVGERVLASWRDVVDAFKQGALAGLLSTILTAIINSLVTTAKRAVRVIREGLLSLVRAVKTLASPPAGMDGFQAAHEASKLVAAGIATSAGIAAEEAVEKAIVAAVPILAPIAPILSVAAVGLASGLTSVLLTALLDRLDFFGAIARERGDKRLAAMRKSTDRLLDELLFPASG